jgi:hypothetical protein
VANSYLFNDIRELIFAAQQKLHNLGTGLQLWR